MIKFAEIRSQPTYLHREAVSGCQVVETAFRSYYLIEKVKELLSANVPTSVIMEIIEDVETAPAVEWDPRDYQSGVDPSKEDAAEKMAKANMFVGYPRPPDGPYPPPPPPPGYDTP